MGVYKELFHYIPDKKPQAVLSVVLSVLASVLQILPFYFLWKIFQDIVVYQNDTQAWMWSIRIVGCMIAYTIVYFAALWVSHLIAFRLETNLRKAGIHHLMQASFSFFDKNPSGKIRKIIDDNAAETHMTVAHLIPDNASAIATPILMFIVMAMVDWPMAGLLLLVTGISAWQMKGMMGEQDFMRKYQAALERMNAETVEYVRGMPVLKVFRTTVQSFRALYASITSYAKLAYEYSLSCRTSYVSFQVLLHIFITFTIPFAIFALNRGADVSWIVIKILFFATFAGKMFTCFMRVMWVGMYQFNASTSVGKLHGLIEEMKKDAVPEGTETEFSDSSIEFRHVSFRYEEQNVLEDLSFTLPEKKTYALVGSSGGRKSTIAKLISGFYKMDSGEVLIGGKPITSYTQEALMQKIAFVFQQAKLFKTSIYENVQIGNPDASYKEVMDALEAAMCNDILDKFPDRENTIIGSKGVYLSGGETQRIAIARAILKNADIIILDEASAAADPENEFEIQRAFTNLMRGKTVILIAHRLSSIRKVDEILVVDNGKITERGNDRDLILREGRYLHLQDLFSQANRWRVYENEN